MRPLPARVEIQERLRRIFPPESFDTVMSNPAAAAAVAAMIYVDAVVPESAPPGPDAAWARPTTCLWLSDTAYARSDEGSRLAWRAAAVRGRRQVAELLRGWGAGFEPWYADNTRETLRDETFPRWLRSGALRQREGIRTSSSAPRWALTGPFADLFDPALCGADLEQAIDAWREDRLSPGDLIRIRTARVRASQQHAVGVTLPDGTLRRLEPGESSLIIKGVVEQWAPHRLGDPVVLTISEPGAKFVVADRTTLEAVGLGVDVSLLLCDALLVDVATRPTTFWIVEAVASDGPIDEQRKEAFLGWAAEQGIPAASCRFLTAFSSRHSSAARRRLKDLAVGTYAWYADEPTHELAWYALEPTRG